MTAKTTMSGSQHHRTPSQRKVSPLLEWYQRTTGNIVDRMCCVSYASQVDDGEEPVDYDEMRAKMVVPDWIHDYKHEQNYGSKPHKRHDRGHLTLQGDTGDCMGKCHYSPYSPSGDSVATATTVSTSTVRTSRTMASRSTINTSNRSNQSDEVIVDDIVYVRSESLDDRISSTRDVVHADRYRRYRSAEDRRESPPRLQSIPSDSLPNLPYLTLTQGYEC